MAKTAPKVPTIQDLTREELLRLIPMISPLGVKPILILRAQRDEAWEAYRRASQPLAANGDDVRAALARHKACVDRGASVKVIDKAWRGYLAAREAYRVTNDRAERIYRRHERLNALCRALTDREG